VAYSTYWIFLKFSWNFHAIFHWNFHADKISWNLTSLGVVRKIKLVIRQLLGASKYNVTYRIVSYCTSMCVYVHVNAAKPASTLEETSKCSKYSKYFIALIILSSLLCVCVRKCSETTCFNDRRKQQQVFHSADYAVLSADSFRFHYYWLDCRHTSHQRKIILYER